MTGEQWYSLGVGALVIVGFAVGALVTAYINRRSQ